MKIAENFETIPKLAEMAEAASFYQKWIAPVFWKASVSKCAMPDGSRPKSLRDYLAVCGVDIRDGWASRLFLARLMSAGARVDIRSPEGAEAAKLLAGHLEFIRPETVLNDPYFQAIRLDRAELSGGTGFGMSLLRAGECFPVSEPDAWKWGMGLPKIGICAAPIEYPLLTQDGLAWMSCSPPEIATVASHIKQARGRVLALGLGIGYFQFMAHLKADVEKIVTIENNPAIIDIFKRIILPQFPNPEKIEIIEDDAIKYLAGAKDGEYEYCFADIWKDQADVFTWMSVKNAGRHLRQTEVSYWINESMLFALTDKMHGVVAAGLFGMGRKPAVPNIPEGATKFMARHIRARAACVNFIRAMLKGETIDSAEGLAEIFTKKFWEEKIVSEPASGLIEKFRPF